MIPEFDEDDLNPDERCVALSAIPVAPKLAH
jgi:hypothetical protein